MPCRICGRNNCTSTFHSIDQQEQHEADYGEYQDKIDTLTEENAALSDWVDEMISIVEHCTLEGSKIADIKEEAKEVFDRYYK